MCKFVRGERKRDTHLGGCEPVGPEDRSSANLFSWHLSGESSLFAYLMLVFGSPNAPNCVPLSFVWSALAGRTSLPQLRALP